MASTQTRTSSLAQAPAECTLSEDRRPGRMEVVANVFSRAEEFRELPDGYEFRFPASAERAHQLTDFILEERTCCAFFQFELVLEPHLGPIWLRLRGDEGVKPFIRARLNASDPNSAEASSYSSSEKQTEGNMTSAEPIASEAPIPDREAIRTELEATRRAYHRLVNSVSSDDWKRKSGNPSWRVGQLLWHLAWGAGYFPRGVEECRKGKAMNPPRWVMNPLNMLITRIGSRRATPQSVAEKYDAAHAAILACLDGVEDDEWSKGVRPLGAFGAYKTVTSVFQSVTLHFSEHEADILRGLGR